MPARAVHSPAAMFIDRKNGGLLSIWPNFIRPYSECFVTRYVSTLTLALLLSACQSVPGLTDAEAQQVTAYTGAKIFDGEEFQAKTLCVLGQVIVRCPVNPGQSVDLSGQFLTPPFGDAHTHHFDGRYTLDWHRSMGLKSGAFYAMTMTAPTQGVIEIRDRLSGPGNIDVATSLGGITGPESHPAEIYEALALNIRSYEDQVARSDEIHAGSRAADNAYYVVETEADVRAKIDLLLGDRPDHIKVFLRKSDRYADGFGKWGPGGGIDPTLLPLIAELTDQAGVRLAVANSNIHDFRASLNVGADIITHLPCYQDSEADPDSIYYDVDVVDDCLISDTEALAAAELGMVSTLIVTEWVKDRPADLVAWEQQNIAALKAAGAPLVVATNAYGSTLTPGLIAGVDKGFVSPAEMLRMATMTTLKTIFPDRNIGCLDVGCEASFISFPVNPIEDVAIIGEISYRVKDGQFVEVAAEGDEG